MTWLQVSANVNAQASHVELACQTSEQQKENQRREEGRFYTTSKDINKNNKRAKMKVNENEKEKEKERRLGPREIGNIRVHKRVFGVSWLGFRAPNIAASRNHYAMQKACYEEIFKDTWETRLCNLASVDSWKKLSEQLLIQRIPAWWTRSIAWLSCSMICQHGRQEHAKEFPGCITTYCRNCADLLQPYWLEEGQDIIWVKGIYWIFGRMYIWVVPDRCNGYSWDPATSLMNFFASPPHHHC